MDGARRGRRPRRRYRVERVGGRGQSAAGCAGSPTASGEQEPTRLTAAASARAVQVALDADPRLAGLPIEARAVSRGAVELRGWVPSRSVRDRRRPNGARRARHRKRDQQSSWCAERTTAPRRTSLGRPTRAHDRAARPPIRPIRDRVARSTPGGGSGTCSVRKRRRVLAAGRPESPTSSRCRRPTSRRSSTPVTVSTTRCRTSSSASSGCAAAAHSGCRAPITPASPPRTWWSASSPRKGSPASTSAARRSSSGCGPTCGRPASGSCSSSRPSAARADWSRTYFTLDEDLSRAVREVFVRLYEKGLVYRGHYIINWCPRCLTALSNEEAEKEEVDGRIWHIRYPLADGGGHITVATTRPETMLGDTGVAVHPDDERYRRLVGRQLRLPLTDRLIPVVADEAVDPAFGSGRGQGHAGPRSHRLRDRPARRVCPRVDVMTPEARMSLAAPERFQGLDRFEARRRVVRSSRRWACSRRWRTTATRWATAIAAAP